jgi:hypothetical protein
VKRHWVCAVKRHWVCAVKRHWVCAQDWGILPRKPVVIGPIHKEQEMPGGGRGRPRTTVIYGKQLSLDVLLAEQKWHLALRDFRSKQRDIVHSGHVLLMCCLCVANVLLAISCIRVCMRACERACVAF